MLESLCPQQVEGRYHRGTTRPLLGFDTIQRFAGVAPDSKVGMRIDRVSKVQATFANVETSFVHKRLSGYPQGSGIRPLL